MTKPIKKSVNLNFSEYPSIESLPPELHSLTLEALSATGTSYSPYSQFAVGCAVLLQNGVVVKGSNQENGAYPSGLCAERVALFYAGSSNPGVAVSALAIAALHNGELVGSPIAPCGACRQVMMEYRILGGKPMQAVLAGKTKVIVVHDTKDLLPLSFVNAHRAMGHGG